MGRILVLYHSITGCVEQMAELVAEGAREIPGMEVRLRSCDEATHEDVRWADGLAVGTPTNLGGIAWRMKQWWDEFAAENWNKVDGKIATVFSSQGGHGGGAELTCQAMATVLLNFGFLTFGITDYVSKIHTLHYGACVAKQPRNENDKAVCRRLGLRLAEWIAYFVDMRRGMHPLLTTKAADQAKAAGTVKPDATAEDLPKPVHVVVVKDVPLENQEKWLKMAEELAMNTWRERGCLQYNFVRSGDTDNRFIITEQWSSRACLEDHFNTEHFKRLIPAMDDISTTVSLDICSDALGRRQQLPQPQAGETKPKKSVLIYTTALDYVHGSLPAAAAFFSKLCVEKGFEPVVSDSPALLEGPDAPEFDVIVFVNNSGELFDPAKSVLQKHIDAGRGIMGVHAAIASFLNDKDASGATHMKATSDVMKNIFGTHFEEHPPPQKGKVIINKKNASLVSSGFEGLPDEFEHEDEFFNYSSNPSELDDINVIATVDESTYEGGRMGNEHPVVWSRELGDKNARVFYSALGHFSSFYNGRGPQYLARILEKGLDYVARTARVKASPVAAADDQAQVQEPRLEQSGVVTLLLNVDARASRSRDYGSARRVPHPTLSCAPTASRQPSMAPFETGLSRAPRGSRSIASLHWPRPRSLCQGKLNPLPFVLEYHQRRSPLAVNSLHCQVHYRNETLHRFSHTIIEMRRSMVSLSNKHDPVPVEVSLPNGQVASLSQLHEARRAAMQQGLAALEQKDGLSVRNNCGTLCLAIPDVFRDKIDKHPAIPAIPLLPSSFSVNRSPKLKLILSRAGASHVHENSWQALPQPLRGPARYMASWKPGSLLGPARCTPSWNPGESPHQHVSPY
eukprot:CAMPEP_0202118874 /NCGR_PEP_ID=MMETSP0965-20130614/43367_1 /ASSEMBLY_ACC=CAM_ASM_000507 /TAXON_ID=4773 /ORGANISM="Schizochytrium aggregatum, Strain ATCC28209" /LENGTH=852 /DNA_ID=CAMNT_0048688797 /DNA_START=56 /DNA_END=2618 /DNA_ORIENTATION=+